MFKQNFISLIFASGGIGSRMAAPLPKQYLPLNNKKIALYSFDLFCQMEEIDEIVVVCNEEFQPLFASQKKSIIFATPGKSRQLSIFNGFCKTSPDASILCTHDAARPLIKKREVIALLEKTVEVGAATLAVPVSCTIKQGKKNLLVEKTLKRANLWEIQTPQAMRRAFFERGFQEAFKLKVEVTDDVSLAELIGESVGIVMSNRRNLKITDTTDLALAEILNKELCATN